MKKKLSLLLCAALTATTLAGCGRAQSSPAKPCHTRSFGSWDRRVKRGRKDPYLCCDGGTGNTGPHTE